MDAQTIKSLVAIFLAAILTENYILNKFLGICPFLGVSKKLDTAVGMSCAVTVVMVISTAVTWPLYTYLLVPNGLGYLQTIVFILVIAALVQLLETALRKYMPPAVQRPGHLPAADHHQLRCAGRDHAGAGKGRGGPHLWVPSVFGQRLWLGHRLFGGHGALCRRAGAPGELRHSRDALKACPSPWWRPPWWRSASWASTAWWTTCCKGRVRIWKYLTPILIVGIIGLLAGVILAVASIVMAVPKDEKAEALEEVLPGANCGACGFSGCPGYAAAMAKGEAQPGLCSPGGAEVAQKCAEILGGGDVADGVQNRLGPLPGQLRQHHRQDAVRRHPKLLGGGLPHGGRHQLPFWLHGPGGLPAGLPVRRHHRVQRPGPH